MERLAAYERLLRRWQPAVNLVGPASLADVWRRHMLDSAQLLPFLPTSARSLVDLGSGAGFPGLVLAIMGAPGVNLVESNRRKCAFLAEAARVTAAEIHIHACRIADLKPWPVDVVTARGLAPLSRLLPLAYPFVGGRGTCLFPKGARAGEELTEATEEWKMRVERFPSASDASGIILRLSEISRESSTTGTR